MIESTRFLGLFWVSQFLWMALESRPMVLKFPFTPHRKAVAEQAESATCESTQYVCKKKNHPLVIWAILVCIDQLFTIDLRLSINHKS